MNELSEKIALELKTFEKRQKAIKYLLLTVIALISSGIYLNTLHGEFILDDNWVILKNEWIRDIRNIPAIFSRGVWSFLPKVQADADFVDTIYRPFTHIFLMVGYHISGLSPWGYHLVSIITHAVNSALVFLIISALFNKDTAPPAAGDFHNQWPQWFIPFFTALIFASHPINTESVAWISAISEISFVMFYLLSFYLYIKKRYSLSLFAFLLTILCKETSFTLPILLVGYDLLVKKEPMRPVVPWIKRYWPYGIATVSGLGLRAYILGEGIIGAGATGIQFTFYQYLLNIPILIWQYIKKLILPVNLIFFHHSVFEPVYSFWEFKSISFILMSVISGYILYRMGNAEPLFGLSFLFFIVPLLPVLYLCWIKRAPVYADRFLYLPSAGFALFAGVLSLRVVSLLKNQKRAKVLKVFVGTFLVVIICIYSAGTVKRNSIWNSAYTLWKDTVSKAPENMVAMVNYGHELARRGELDAAISAYKEVIRDDPRHAPTHNNLGIVYARKGFFEAAIAEFQEAVALDPTNEGAKQNLEKALKLLEHKNESPSTGKTSK